MSRPDGAVGVEPWDAEWAAARAAEALRYLGTHYPECLDAPRVLDEHEEDAHEAAVRGDKDAYLEAFRCYMRAGRAEALRIRRGAAWEGLRGLCGMWRGVGKSVRYMSGTRRAASNSL
jgi:hypothetical protein